MTAIVNNISTILCVIGEIAFVVCFIDEITGIMDYHETLFLVHVVFVISMLFILVSTIKGIVKAPKENIYHNIGCIVFWLYGYDGCHSSMASTGRETSYFIRLGILIFFFMEIVQIMKSSSPLISAISKMSCLAGLLIMTD